MNECIALHDFFMSDFFHGLVVGFLLVIFIFLIAYSADHHMRMGGG